MPLTVPTDREEKILADLPGCSGDRKAVRYRLLVGAYQRRGKYLLRQDF